MAGQAEVKISLNSGDYLLLQSLLKFFAKQITPTDLTVILKTMGYSERMELNQQIIYCAEQLVKSIK